MATERGEATRARLIEATAQVVAEVGYANASTRAIAKAAGVAEGTIYRHFPNKAAMFLAAAVDRNDPIIEWMSGLPSRAGSDTVEDNLTDCLVHLSALRKKMLPLELALLTDPELAEQQRLVAFGPPAAPRCPRPPSPSRRRPRPDGNGHPGDSVRALGAALRRRGRPRPGAPYHRSADAPHRDRARHTGGVRHP